MTNRDTKPKGGERTRDPIHTVGRYQRVRLIVIVVCLIAVLGLLLWQSLAS